MKRLDLAAIREHSEFWWDEVNLACPFCKGEGGQNCRDLEDNDKRKEDCKIIQDARDCLKKKCLNSCPIDAAHFDGESCNTCEHGDDAFYPDDVCIGCDEQIECDECTDGYMEVMWDTGFGVYVPHSSDWEELRKVACENGFALIKWQNESWLLMLSCGQDNTWKIHFTRWLIQGYLHREDMEDCLGSGGYVFLGWVQRDELCRYIKSHTVTPDNYAKQYERDLEKLDEIILHEEGR